MSNPYPDYKSNTITTPNAPAYSFHKPPNNITFFNNLNDKQVEVLRITKEGITANPDLPVDEAADAVLRALDGHIKNLVSRPWVGLTNEEIIDLIHPLVIADMPDQVTDYQIVKAIEAKLKEKNS